VFIEEEPGEPGEPGEQGQKENTSVAQPERKKEKRILHSAKNRDDFPDDDSSSCVLPVFVCFVHPSSFYCRG